MDLAKDFSCFMSEEVSSGSLSILKSSGIKDLREASSPPPMKAPLESAETAFRENASSMGASESFRGGCKSASRMTLTLLSVPPPKADCQDTQVCKLNSKEKPKIATSS